jgi:hypothetical protein
VSPRRGVSGRVRGSGLAPTACPRAADGGPAPSRPCAFLRLPRRAPPFRPLPKVFRDALSSGHQPQCRRGRPGDLRVHRHLIPYGWAGVGGVGVGVGVRGWGWAVGVQAAREARAAQACGGRGATSAAVACAQPSTPRPDAGARLPAPRPQTGTLAGMFLIDRIGRRRLLVIGSLGTSACVMAAGGASAALARAVGLWPRATLSWVAAGLVSLTFVSGRAGRGGRGGAARAGQRGGGAACRRRGPSRQHPSAPARSFIPRSLTAPAPCCRAPSSPHQAFVGLASETALTPSPSHPPPKIRPLSASPQRPPARPHPPPPNRPLSASPQRPRSSPLSPRPPRCPCVRWGRARRLPSTF